MIPKLARVTNLCNRLGYGVVYETTPVYPGLVQIRLIDKRTGRPHKVLMLDPKLIYGDQERIITQDNMSGDIRKECFIPIQENLLNKVVKGSLNKDDRKKLNERLPRVMTDYRGSYHLLDRVDLRSLANTNIQFKEWRDLIINISNVLRDQNLPLCRYRLMDYKSPTQFKLYCDEGVLSAFKTPIFNEPSHIEAVCNRLWVDYDASKYPNPYYTYGYTNMAKEVTPAAS